MREEINRAVEDFENSSNANNSCSNRLNQTSNEPVCFSNDEHKLLKNEPPPPYDSISKSTSLPNYNTVIELDNKKRNELV